MNISEIKIKFKLKIGLIFYIKIIVINYSYEIHNRIPILSFIIEWTTPDVTDDLRAMGAASQRIRASAARRCPILGTLKLIIAETSDTATRHCTLPSSWKE